MTSYSLAFQPASSIPKLSQYYLASISILPIESSYFQSKAKYGDVNYWIEGVFMLAEKVQRLRVQGCGIQRKEGSLFQDFEVWGYGYSLIR
jgi:hypothetical protein